MLFGKLMGSWLLGMGVGVATFYLGHYAGASDTAGYILDGISSFLSSFVLSSLAISSEL